MRFFSAERCTSEANLEAFVSQEWMLFLVCLVLEAAPFPPGRIACTVSRVSSTDVRASLSARPRGRARRARLSGFPSVLCLSFSLAAMSAKTGLLLKLAEVLAAVLATLKGCAIIWATD
eukprot:1978067-Prymnesium_polylepis.1